MTVYVSYPGVYVDEFAPAAPIQGVGTGTPAFIGVAAAGPINQPTLVTSWDMFTTRFGELPVPGFFLWYAVRGFFENQGQSCYVVRASNGGYSKLVINTTVGGLPVFSLSARQPGVPAIGVTIAADHLLTNTNTSLYQPKGTLTQDASVGDKRLLLGPTEARQFRPGDNVTVAAGGESLQILRVSTAAVSTTLAVAVLNATAASISVDSFAGSPMSGPYTILVDAEEMTVTAGHGTTTWTVTRGANGTAAAAHASKTSVSYSSGVLQLSSEVRNIYPRGSIIHFANAPAGTTVFRLKSIAVVPPGALVPGTMLTFNQTGTSLGTAVVAGVQTEPIDGDYTYRVTLRQGLPFSINMTQPASVQSEEFTLTLTPSGQTYAHLAMDPAHPRYYLGVVNGDANAVVTITPQEPPPSIAMPGDIPVTGTQQLAIGASENLQTINDAVFIAALDTLHGINHVNMIAVPDRTSTFVQQAVIEQCELLADRFGVLDAQPGQDPLDPTQLPAQRLGLDSTRGYAALYYPWLRVAPAIGGDPVLVPPSGHACGIFARSDTTRGVFKAPANEIVSGAIGLEHALSDIDHGILNLAGINAFRVFQTGGRPVLYGARTTAKDTNWQYVNIRRLFIYLEKSIQEGIRWAVFEPNNTQLWQKLKRSIGNFLRQEWRAGALFGERESDAYYVRIDDTLNPFTEQQLGRLHIEIGVRPSYPAEFIIVRIGIWAGGSSASES